MSQQPEHDRALLASDADRTVLHDILAAAMTRGYLTPSEYEDRANKAVAAKTFGDLDLLVADLPLSDIAAAQPTAQSTPAHGPTSGHVTSSRIAVFSGSNLHRGATVGSHLSAVALWGGVKIDLRTVTFTAPKLTITAFALWGGISIVLPDNANARVDGFGFMGGFGDEASGPGSTDGPHIRVNGLAVMGGVNVKRRPLRKK